MEELKLGLTFRQETEVVYENTAAAVGSGAAEVFSTPSMIALMETAAMYAVAPCLDEGQGTVGVHLDVAHLAATPTGHRVWAVAELIEIDRKMLIFKVEAFSDVEKIGEGIHKRCIINNEKFFSKVYEKYGK